MVQFFSQIVRSKTGIAGLSLLGLVLLIAILGPVVRPYDPTKIVGAPFSLPGAAHWLGTDTVGRDVFSRVLAGGTIPILVATAATLAAYIVGVCVGITAGYVRGRTDFFIIGALDVLMSVPPIILIFVLLTGGGTDLWLVAVGIAIVLMPGVARITRAATREIVSNEYVEAAVARGESRWFIIWRELLPNLWSPLLADFGIRIAYAVGIYAGIAFLGFGPQPPTPDWGVMINENRSGFLIQPWAVISPAILIAALTVSVNWVADAYVRGIGRSAVPHV
ncbi:hypothetical protein LK09_08020 [Microbacterium mangrovi]|uniref:ABC transmembrane type-1 domain-containing protein n=2 Tax=Microbacterium mangrovi TaxID=1348253 RepID=A0A0B2AB87_9MICO|nr:hypothetical protein LK09_08020 [Microbacterium mangrovi]